MPTKSQRAALFVPAWVHACAAGRMTSLSTRMLGDLATVESFRGCKEITAPETLNSDFHASPLDAYLGVNM